MTGMGGDKPKVIAWQHWVSGEVGHTSLHRVPVEQFVHDCDMEASCMCGPALVVTRVDDEPVTIAQHFPLEGEYYEEEHLGDLLSGLNYEAIPDDEDEW